MELWRKDNPIIIGSATQKMVFRGLSAMQLPSTNIHWSLHPGNNEYLSSKTSMINARYNIPYLIDKAGCGNNIQGEVYEVDGKMLANLDILEDHPNYYQRRVEPVASQGTEGKPMKDQTIYTGIIALLCFQGMNDWIAGYIFSRNTKLRCWSCPCWPAMTPLLTMVDPMCPGQQENTSQITMAMSWNNGLA